MVYTACAVFLYGGTSDQPLPPLTWKRVRTTSSGWRAATVVNPAAAPAAAFSHVNASAAGVEPPGGISG